MMALLTSPLFYLFVTVGIYALFAFLSKKFKTALLNPLLWTIVLLVGYLLLIVWIDKNSLDQQYIDAAVDQYQSAANIFDILLAPVTVALALPLYLNRNVLKENWLPILVATVVGVGTSIGSVALLGYILGLDGSIVLALYPRGVTTAIAKEVAVILGVGQHTAILVAVVVITGIVGAVLGPFLIKLFRDDRDIVVGLSLGSASHAMGTAKSFEYSSKAGAIASVSMITNGLLTVIVALLVSLFLKA